LEEKEALPGNWNSITILKLGVGCVPEDRRIFPTLSVRENLILGIKPGQKDDAEGWTIEKGYKHFPGLEKRDKQQGAYHPEESSRCSRLPGP
jgi:ABC-type branched-subunit amino acid transport system ATPase component